MAKIMLQVEVQVAVDLAEWQRIYGTADNVASREDALNHIPATITEVVTERLDQLANGAKLHTVCNPVTMPFAGVFAEGDRVRSTVSTMTGTVVGDASRPGWFNVREDNPQVVPPTGYATWHGLNMAPLEV